MRCKLYKTIEFQNVLLKQLFNIGPVIRPNQWWLQGYGEELKFEDKTSLYSYPASNQTYRDLEDIDNKKLGRRVVIPSWDYQAGYRDAEATFFAAVMNTYDILLPAPLDDYTRWDYYGFSLYDGNEENQEAIEMYRATFQYPSALKSTFNAPALIPAGSIRIVEL